MEVVFRRGEEAIIYFGQQTMLDPTKVFSLDDPARRACYKRAYLTFTGGPGCKEENIDPRKGIWLVGDTGVGKSILMRTMQKMFKDTERRFKRVTAFDLKTLLEGTYTAFELKEMYGNSLKCDLLIDDVDADELNCAGPTSIVEEILYERNELFNTAGFKTHIITYLERDNDKRLPTNLIDTKSSRHIVDRVRQMTNLITFEGGSLRK